MNPPSSKRQKKDVLAAEITLLPHAAPFIILPTPPEKTSQEVVEQIRDEPLNRNLDEVPKMPA